MTDTINESSCTSLSVVAYDENNVSNLYRNIRNFTFDEHTISIEQNWRDIGVAAVVWDAAVIMCNYLSKNAHLIKGKNVLELGAGTGLVGIMAHKLGAKTVTITDRKMALRNLRKNVKLNINSSESLSIEELDWSSTDLRAKFPSQAYDIVLGADIVYIEDTFPDLLRTLKHFTVDPMTSTPSPLLLLSSKLRYQRDHNFYAGLRMFTVVKEVLIDHDIHVYRVTAAVK